MYLSRVEVNTNSHLVMKKLVHLGVFHDWVEKSFPKEISEGVRTRHLWRLDQLGGKTYLLVLSQEKPDLKLLEENGVPNTAQTKQYDSFIEKLHEGQKLQFRLTANPTYSVSQQDGRSKIYPHITISQQESWLVKKSQTEGFSVASSVGQSFSVIGRDRALLRHKGSKQVHLSRVSFEGTLTITNIKLFKKGLIEGIGREKAYGMGLLTVIPER